MPDAKNVLGRTPPDSIKDVFVWHYCEIANRPLSARRWGQGGALSFGLFFGLSWLLSLPGGNTTMAGPLLAMSGTGYSQQFGRPDWSAGNSAHVAFLAGLAAIASTYAPNTDSQDQNISHPKPSAGRPLDPRLPPTNPDHSQVSRDLPRKITQFKTESLQRMKSPTLPGIPNLSAGLAWLPPNARTPQRATSVERVTVPPSVLESYAGTYDFALPFKLRIVVTCENGQLFTQLSGQTKVPVLPQSETKFCPQGVGGTCVEFEKNRNGTQVRVTLFMDGHEIRGHRQ